MYRNNIKIQRYDIMQQHYHCRYRETDETPLAVVVVVVVVVIVSVVIIVVVAFRFYQLPIELRAGRRDRAIVMRYY